MLQPTNETEFHEYTQTLPEDRREYAMWLHWLIRMRWGAIVGIGLVLSLTLRALHQPGVTVVLVIGVVVGLAAANGLLMNHLYSRKPVDAGHIGLQLVFDSAVLALLLGLTGGMGNPFAIMLIIHVAMAAVMLPRDGAIVVGVTVMGFALLLAGNYLPLHVDRLGFDPVFAMQVGSMVAYAITFVSVGWIVNGAVTSLRRRSARLHRVELERGGVMVADDAAQASTT